MFGGNGTIGTRFFAHYNLAEVTGYAGLLALVATFAFISRCTRCGWTGVQRDYVLYFVLFVVGLFAAWGSFTPVGHLFHHIPLFGSTRLQSRNIIVADFSASVLLGWWLDRVQARDTSSAGLEGRARWFSLLPVFVTVALCVAMLGSGPSIVVHFGVTSALASYAKSLSLSLVLHLVIAFAIIGALWWRRRSVKIMRWLLVILSADVIVFLLFCSSGLIGLDAPTEPSPASAIALLGTQGRTAFVDMGAAHLLRFVGLNDLRQRDGHAPVGGTRSLSSGGRHVYSIAPVGARDLGNATERPHAFQHSAFEHVREARAQYHFAPLLRSDIGRAYRDDHGAERRQRGQWSGHAPVADGFGWWCAAAADNDGQELHDLHI